MHIAQWFIDTAEKSHHPVIFQSNNHSPVWRLLIRGYIFILEPRTISEAITCLKFASDILVYASEEEKQEYIRKTGQGLSRGIPKWFSDEGSWSKI